MRVLRKIADDLNFKNRELKLTWAKLDKMGASYPFLLFKKDGRTDVACGIKEVKTEESEKVEFPSAAGIEEEAKPEAAEAKPEEAAEPAESAAAKPEEPAAGTGAEAKPEGAEAKPEEAEEKEPVYQLGVWDPLALDGKRPELVFYSEEEFNEQFTGNALLLKRRYSLTDEKQPFGLRY